MDKKEEDFLKRLQDMFQQEAKEHIHAMSEGLIEFEKTVDSEQSKVLIEKIFREAHSLKGAARSVNSKDIESLCQLLENTFSKLKNEQTTLASEQFDLIHKSLDFISKLISSPETTEHSELTILVKQLGAIDEMKSDKEKSEETKFPKKLNTEKSNVLNDESSKKLPVIREEKLSQLDTVKIPTSKLDPLFLQAEEMIQSNISANQRLSELENINESIELWKTESRKWKEKKFDAGVFNIKEILDRNEELLNEIDNKLAGVTKILKHDNHESSRLVNEHLDSVKKVLMLPVASLTEGLPKLVRDLSRSQGKDAELLIHGKEIEVDKRILEELKDPLIHLVRNCIDHGITKSDERIKTNKSPIGKVNLIFKVTESRHLEIIISDDGSGIDLEKVSAAAVKSGYTHKDELDKLSSQEIMSFIFQSGVSTSPFITDMSGRGLGLAIVKEKVEKLGGSVTVESHSNIGTFFKFILPLTLSTFRAVIVRTGEHLFAIPTMNVERVARINREEIKTVANKETIMLEGKILNAINLSHTLGLPVRKNNSSILKSEHSQNINYIQIILLEHSNKTIAFIIDDVIDENQFLIKELGKQLKYVRNISGATVIGSGKVVPVINVSGLIKSALRLEDVSRISEIEELEAERQYKILVTDDSITSRTLIKSIIETAGYYVETAVDGIDAYTKAAVGEFDMIVTDVDMPRMNGFELTTKIRNDKKLTELPVVLVTALESNEDREHGIDVGANAYIVKSSFDQSNLLEVIKKIL